MKLRWREHEMVMVTIIGVIVLGIYLWQLFVQGYHAFEAIYAAPFEARHFPFNLFRNVLVRDLGLGLLIYLSYLWINLFTIPRLLGLKGMQQGLTEGKIPFDNSASRSSTMQFLKRFLFALAQIILIVLMLIAAYFMHEYYASEYLFNYPGFSIFPKNGINPNPLINVPGLIQSVTSVMLIYILYAGLRELIIWVIQWQIRGRSYRIMILNQITAFLVVYLSIIPIGTAVLKVQAGSPLFVMYLSLLSSVFLVFLNLYWFFPSKGEQNLLKPAKILRLLAITFVCTFPVPFFFGFGITPALFLFFWAFQLFIITPLSWLVYQLQKDKILELRGLTKALLKSKTDLQFLRTQINPHFLFNTLNTLYGTALQENAQRTAGGIQKLGDMMRFMLHENNLDFIPMSRETEYLKNYISLQKLRTRSSPEITIEENIQDQKCHHNISPMIFIPLVENAFKHGISLNEKSWIRINLRCDEKNIFFEVCNSIHPRPANDPEDKKSGIGLKNLVDRLKIIYPAKHHITVREDGKEFVVSLAIEP